MNRLEIAPFIHPTPKLLGWVIAICLHLVVGYYLFQPQHISLQFNQRAFIPVQVIGKVPKGIPDTQFSSKAVPVSHKRQDTKREKPVQEKVALNTLPLQTLQKRQEIPQPRAPINRTEVVAPKHKISPEPTVDINPVITVNIITTAPIQSKPIQPEHGRWQLTKNIYKVQPNADVNNGIVLNTFCPVAIKSQDLSLNQDYKVCYRPVPPMPFSAQKSGHCILIYDITNTGRVNNIRLKHCTEQHFEAPSVNVAKKWYFYPKVENGQTVMVADKQTRINYRLKDEFDRIIPESHDLTRTRNHQFK